jgi:hypothetical protein
MEKNNIKTKVQEVFKKVGTFFARWFFMLTLIAGSFFCVFVWYKYIWKAEWDDTKKQQYISEQAKFSFDKKGYQDMINLMESRQDKLQNFPRFTGRDLFFPEGF